MKLVEGARAWWCGGSQAAQDVERQPDLVRAQVLHVVQQALRVHMHAVSGLKWKGSGGQVCVVGSIDRDGNQD